MRRLLPFLLLIVASARGEKELVDLRLNEDPTAVKRGWLHTFDESGISFERFGEGRTRFLSWDELVSEDAQALRTRLGLIESAEEPAEIVDGHRLRLVDGTEIDGLLIEVGEDGRHWLRQEGLVLPYPGDRIRSVKPQRMRASSLFTPEELYLRRLEKHPPRTAKQHRDLADWLFAQGEMERAEVHYREAIARDATLTASLEPLLIEIREAFVDETARRLLQKAKSASALRGDHEGARAMLLELAASRPESRRAALRALDAIEVRRQEELRRRAHLIKHEALRDLVRDLLMKKDPSLDEAMSWCTAKMPEELRSLIAARMDLSLDEVTALLGRPATDAAHWAGYWSGSFIVSHRSKGSSRTDPERWWRRYPDVETRTAFLRAYAAERLPELFEALQVKFRECDRCGGTGRVRSMSVTPAKGGGSQDQIEICPRCNGAAKDRIVGYR